MNRIKRNISFLLLMLLPFLAEAQNGVWIKGTVLDSNNQPVIGAAVMIKGTTTGVVAATDGSFEIKVPNEKAVLVFSSLGYETKEVQAVSGKQMKVILNEVTSALDEVVLVAYGKQKKVTVTGAVSSVTNKEIVKSTNADFQTSLYGRLPGLSIQQTTGMPGKENVSMYLRGIATFGDSSPLILIDGVPREGLGNLDNNEVENVTILKDAASTAVFGVRGANGVILVTTRRGEEGKTQLSATASYSMQSIIYKGYRIHSWDYAKLINLRNENSGIADAYNDWQIGQYESGADPVFFPDRDVWSDYTKKFAPQYKVDVNASGGNKRAKYFVNASYVKQDGIFKHLPASQLGYDPSFGMQRLNYRSNIDYKISKNLSASINVSGYFSKTRMIPWDDGMEWSDPNFDHPWITLSVMGGLDRTTPTLPGPGIPANTVDNNGNPLPEGGWIVETYQSYPRLNFAGYIDQFQSSLNTSTGLEYNLGWLLPGLTAKAQGSFDVSSMGWLKASRFYNSYSYYLAKSPEEKSYFFQREWNGSFHNDSALWFYPNGGRGQSSYYRINGQASLNYDNTFAEKHEVSAMLLAQRDYNVSNGSSSLYLPYNMIYFSARATYSYDKRYTVEVNLGYNGSEQFAAKHRWGLFPAVSVGYAVSQEPWFRNNIESDLIDYLKLRASYGIVGNDKIGSQRFLYLDDMSVSTGGVIPTLGRGNYIKQGMVGNENLTWETSAKQNYGVDINFLRDFQFSFDWFKEYRNNILLTRQTIPEVQGILTEYLPKANMGAMENHGYEITLNYSKYVNDWTFQIGGSYAFARNKILNYDEVARPTGDKNYLYPYQTTGFSYGQSWGLQVDYSDGAGNGFINNDEDLAKYSKMYSSGGYVPDAFLGDWKYKDQNGDNKIDDKDVVPIGYSWAVPEITYSGTVRIGWKNFDISALVQGVAHKSSYLVVGVESDGYFTGEWQMHSWTPQRFANGEKITYRALSTRALSSAEYCDYLLNDLSYTRLKNLEIGYTIPASWAAKIGLKSARFSIGGENLWTLSHLKAKIIDPESSLPNSYPMMRTINFAVNVTM
jgi:TonB-linked SusC/RagA family outer membrane protein